MERFVNFNKPKTLNPELLKQYEAETLQRCNRMVRFVTIFVIFAGNPAFLLLDYLIAKNNFINFVIVRGIMVLGCVIIYLVSRTKRGIKYSMWLAAATSLVCASTITVLIHWTGGSTSNYYNGLLIVFFALCIWLPITFRMGLACGMIIFQMYNVPFIATNSVTDWVTFINNNYFIIVIFFLSISSLKFYNDIRFNEFKSRFEMQQANQDLKRITDELEETNQKLLTHDKLKTEFFTNVSHELRTPLTLILAPLNTLIHERQDIVPSAIRGTLSIM